MRYLLYLLSLLLAMVIKLTVADFLSIYGIVPDFIIIIVCAISFLESRSASTIWGFFIGLVEDLSGSGLVGSLALTRSIVAFLAATILHFRVQKTVSAAMVVGVLSLLNNLLLFVFQLHGSAAIIKGVFMQVLFPSLYTLIVAIAIFSIVPASFWEKIYKAEAVPFR